MFTFLGRLATRHPWKILCAWLVLGLGLTAIAPRWEKNAQDDDIRFLPDRCDSVKGYRLLEQAFPRDVYASRLIFALERKDGPLTSADFALVNTLVDDLEKLRKEEPALKISSIHSHNEPFVGKRLQSKDGQCVLIQVSLGTPYLALQTLTSVDRAEKVVRERLRQTPNAPEIYITGPAGVGRDLISASASSLDNTTLATIILVIIILLGVYRAPLLALVPLATIAVSVWVALSMLSLCTLIPGFYLVNISQIFAIVMLYGAGTDYCLFLISRYREEMAGGSLMTRSLQTSVGKVGAALAASAGTVICGLGMMGMAEFAKVRCGGPAIALSLAVSLAASLTLTPALLRVLGRTAFWPGKAPQPAPRKEKRDCLWTRLSHVVAAHPLLIWSCAVIMLSPLALLGFQVKPNYRATAELSQSSSSVLGLNVIQRHFTAGETGPVSVLLASRTPWESPAGQKVVSHLSQAMARLDNVAEVRSLTQPLGEPLPFASTDSTSKRQGGMANFLQNVKRSFFTKIEEKTRRAASEFYSAKLDGPVEGIAWLAEPAARTGPVHVTRLDVVLRTDPFDPASVPALDVIQVWVKHELPRNVPGMDGLQGETYGVTVSTRDLATVTEHDRTRINLLVMGGVFLILLVLVRKLWLAAYLLVTVLFSYLVTLGATTLMATLVTGRPLGEADWRVPFFLFTILVAVGEDYNILLITRAMKERRRRGGVEGMRHALAKTGGTITSCGLIMAGTFATLMLSGLNTLIQIGFALSFGALLDTFIVRPFLVPAFAMMVWRNERPPVEVQPVLLRFPKGQKKQEAA